MRPSGDSKPSGYETALRSSSSRPPFHVWPSSSESHALMCVRFCRRSAGGPFFTSRMRPDSSRRRKNRALTFCTVAAWLRLAPGPAAIGGETLVRLALRARQHPQAAVSQLDHHVLVELPVRELHAAALLPRRAFDRSRQTPAPSSCASRRPAAASRRFSAPSACSACSPRQTSPASTTRAPRHRDHRSG